VVAPAVVKKTWDYYNNWLPSEQNLFVNNVPAQHAWITDNYGAACGHLGSPYINNCSLDMSGLLLQHLYSNTLKPRGQQVTNNLLSFQQAKYVSSTLKLLSMGSIGSIYVPTACQKGAQCSLVVAFHGCLQSYDSVGDVYVRHIGMNDWAEANNIVILYPQVIISPDIPFNPMGCWDWWGYTGADYACKLGGQLATIRNMIRAIAGTFDEPEPTSVVSTTTETNSVDQR